MDDEDTTRGYVPTTTHAEWGAGHPHLLVSSEDDRLRHDLVADVTRIGSAADSDLVLPGTAPLHATIAHDERDEYVLTMHDVGETSADPAAVDDPAWPAEILRTGARFTAGPWTLVFVRDEYADHGRPYGGREGGEYSDQAPQPARPDYTRPDDDSPRPMEIHKG